MQTVNLQVKLGDTVLRNPVLTASGTFGYAKEYADLVPMEKLGGITVKGVSPFPSHGNPPPRTAEVFAGLINSIGLQNPGIDRFIDDPEYLPYLRTLDTAVYVNIWGKTIDDYAEVAARLEAEKKGIAGIEINISCPNIKEGGISFGTNLKMAGQVVAAVRRVTTLPVITKLSPNVIDIGEFARCAVDHGSDMISLINTFPSMVIDVHTRKPKIGSNMGGLSGPVIKPLAVRLVYQAARAVNVPIIGMGGIYTTEDAIEFFLAGATCIAVGTAIFTDPGIPVAIVTGIEQYLRERGIADIRDLIGKVELNPY